MFRGTFALLLALPSLGFAQVSDELDDADLPPLPPAPADHIFDDARLLDDADRAQLDEHVRELKETSNVDLYIAAYTLIPEGIDQRARRLRNYWGADGRSVVVVYLRGSQQLTFSANGDPRTFIPGGELLAIYDVAVKAARDFEDPAERLLAAVDSLSSSIANDLEIRDKNRGVITKRIVLWLGALIATVILLGTLSYLIVQKLARRRAERDTGLYFPEIVVSRRLGAPFGGGIVAEIDFLPREGSSPQSR